MKNTILPLFVALMMFFCMPVYADEPTVEITTSQPSTIDGRIAIDVTTTFGDVSLYNPSVYLSFHLLDEKGNMLQFENERYPLMLGEGQSWQTIWIDPVTYPVEWSGQLITVQFDLVDEENVYWFSDTISDFVSVPLVVSLYAENVAVKEDYDNSTRNNGKNELDCIDTGIVIGINAACIIGMCLFGVKLKRKSSMDS